MSKYWTAHCAVHSIDETPVLLRLYAYILSSSLTLQNATTVGGVVNWVPAAGCQRDIRSTKSAVGAAIWISVTTMVEEEGKCARLMRAQG